MKSVNEIIREVVRRTAVRYNNNISYMFGDWDYVSEQLTVWSKSQETSQLKFPIICLYSPYTEKRTQTNPQVSLNLVIMVNTLKEYLNEEREHISFDRVLRPIYGLFINELYKAKDMLLVPYGMGAVISHDYTENYRYGRKGIISGNGSPFTDYIDAIEITNLELTIKNKECNAKRL